MPIPPPRRKSGRESSPALANSSSCRVSRLPRIVASTTKATDPVEPKQKDYFKRNDSVRLTFTKTSTQSKNVDPKLMIKTSNQVGIKAVKTEAKDGTFVKNATNTFSKSQNNESKNESSLLNNSNKAFDLNSSSSTNASSLNLSNLHPTVCNSFESHPDTSFNAKESSAPSKALPKRNKLPAPKVQRTSSLNGKLTSPQHVSDKSAKINKASTTPNNSISRSPSREKPLRSKKIIRSISSDQPVEELKTGCKPCHSESSLHQKVSAPARPNRSKIPLSKNSSSKPSLRNTLSKESINKMRVNNLKSAENENDLKSEEKSKLSSVLSAPESNSNSQTNIESKNSEKACQGRKKKPDSVLPLDEKKSLNEPLSREENKVIDKKSNASIADFSVRSSLLKPPRQSATLRRAISLRNPIKNAVSNSVENKQNLAAPDGTNDCHLSTLSERKITCEPVDDMSKKLSSESSHVKRLTQPNIGLGDNNSPKSFLIDSADFDSSKKDVLSNKQPSDLYYKTAETKLFQSQSCTKSNLTGVLKESKEASKPSFITDEIKPLENVNSSMCQEQDNTVENSQVSFQSVNLKGIMNSLQGQQSVKEEGQPNYLSLKKQKHLINEKLEPKPSFSKRFSGPVEKKVNKVRGKSDYETDVCYKSTLKGVTSGILSGSNSNGEIPLLCSTVLPVSSKSDLIQSEVIHQCQSWPVKNTISDHVEVIMENSESKEENNAPSDSVTNGIAKKENSVKTPQIKKPARPSLLRRALSSSALVTKKNGESQETKPCNYVSSEILTAEEDRTIVQIMTGVKQICKLEETVASNISVHQKIKTGEPNFETRELENAERSSLDNFLCVQQINSSDATGDKFESPLETRKCAEKSNLDKLLCIKQTNNLETAIEDYHEHLLETRKLEYVEKPTLDNLSCMKQINSSEKIKSGAVNNFNIAEKTDHPQIISRISIPTECELEDSLVRTKLTKIGATQANDTGHDVQYCPVSDIEQQSMFISGFSQCEFDPTVFKQKFLTPQKRQNKSINCVLSSECSPSRSVSPAKSIKEYETLCANIKRRNSELYPESVCTQASSERSRNASPAGYNVGGLGTTRRLYPQEVRPLPPLPPTTPSVHHDTVYATIRPKTSATETYEYPRYDPYGTYGRSRSETYAKYKEYPRTVGFIPQPLNPRELLLSINSTYLANESDYTDYMDAMPGQYTGSEFRPRVQDESSKLRGYGLKAKILRKMSTFSKPKSEPQFDTFYKKKNDILDYATAPDSAQRKLYHSVSRELLSKMEAERQSIKGGGLSVEEIEDFQVLRDEKTPELAEAILYERSNPPVLSSRFARVDLIEDPAYHSALMVIGGERKVVPLHRENLDTSDSRKNGECQYIRAMHLKQIDICHGEFGEEYELFEKQGCYLNNGYQSQSSTSKSIKRSDRSEKVIPSVWRHSYLAHLALSRVESTSLNSVSSLSITSSPGSGASDQLFMNRKWFGSKNNLKKSDRSQSVSTLQHSISEPNENYKREFVSPLSRQKSQKSLTGAVKRRIRSLSNSTGITPGGLNDSFDTQSDTVSNSSVNTSRHSLYEKCNIKSKQIEDNIMSLREKLNKRLEKFDRSFRNKSRSSYFSFNAKTEYARPQSEGSVKIFISAPFSRSASCIAVSTSGSISSSCPEKGEFRPRIADGNDSKCSAQVSAGQSTEGTQLNDAGIDIKISDEPNSFSKSSDEEIIKDIIDSSFEHLRKNRKSINRRSFNPRLSTETILESEPEVYDKDLGNDLSYSEFLKGMKRSFENGSLDAITYDKASTPYRQSANDSSRSDVLSDLNTKTTQGLNGVEEGCTTFSNEIRQRTVSDIPQNTWPKNIAFRSHSTGSPEPHSCHLEYRENITGGTLLNENKVTSVDDDCSMAKNKNFKSQSAWDLRRPWSEASSNRSSGSIAPHRPNGPCEYSAGESRSHSPAPSIGSEGVLQKFRKSFSLRFHRRVPKANEESVDVPLSSQEGTDNLGSDTTFRFGPLAWRASKERKRSKKAVSSRNSKCNSGDSGIQVTRPPSTDFEGLNFVNEFPPTVTQGSPEVNSCTTVPESYVPGSSATAPHSPAEATNPVWLSQVPPSSTMEDGTAKLRRSSSQPLHNDDTKEPRRPSPEGCEVDLGVGYSSEDDLDVDEVTQRYNERVLDPLAIREELLDAVALYDYKGEGPGELSFRKGDSILIGQHSYDDWWYGTCGATSGWLPATFVKVKSSQGIKEPEKHTSIAQLRSNVVNEILQTERDYVKHLEDIVEGYMAQMQRRQDMFSSDQIVTVFGNIGPLYEFQKRFLRDLQSSYNQEKPNETGIGSCFLRHISSFEVYSDYCTQHGRAVAELQNLYANERTAHFLEACRLLRGMADIALDGFLLTPVQRICKYPLQLAELLKHTEESHADFNDVSQALHSMREVATLINERKRMLEGKERLNEWQKLVENWQGGNLAEKSSELIYSGDLQKVSHGGWAKDITMYLFDRQAILCKKDMIKRNSLTYKTRFSTEGCEAVSISGGKDAQYNATVKFAFKVRDSSDKWYLFSCKTLKDRDTWLAAFARDRLLQQGEGFRSLPDGASFDSIRRLEGKANKAVYDRQRLRHIKNRPRAKKIDPVSVLSLQDVTDEGAAIRLDSSRKSSWFSIGSNRSKKRTLLTSPSEV